MEHAEIEQEILEQSISVCPEVDVIRGIDGFSPIANVERVENGAKITVTDKTGTTTTVVMDGQKGERGEKGESGDYNELANIPSINNVQLIGNKSISDLGLASKAELTNFHDEYDAFTEEVASAIESETDARVQSINAEESARINADNGLQEQIDGITASSDVKDIVGTKAELDEYDKTTLGDNDIIKVISDSSHDDAMAYYRYDKDTNAFLYVGKEGPFYTKAESDEKFATQIDLTDYVKKTDYATTTEAGAIKIGNYGTGVSNGTIYASTIPYSTFNQNNIPNSYFVGKGTLNNVLEGRKYLMPEYTQTLPQTGAENKLYLVPASEQPDVLKSAEGKEVTLTDASQGDLEWGAIKGETSQASTSGKNLYQVIPTTNRGLTATLNEDGTVSIKGTATADTCDFATAMTTTLSAGTYTFSITNTLPVRALLRTNAGTNIGVINAGSTSNTFTIKAGSEPTTIRAFIYGLTSGTAYDLKVGFMLETGSSATTFEPYTAGASPNPTYPQEVKTVTGSNKVTVRGKNLLDPYDIRENTSATTSGVEGNVVTYSTTSSRAVAMVKVKPNTTYRFKIHDTSISDACYIVGMKSETQESGMRISWTGGTTITTTDKEEYMLFVFRMLTGHTGTKEEVSNAHAQLEFGSTITTYEPYHEQSVEVNLSGNLIDLSKAKTKAWLSSGSGIEQTSNDPNFVSDYIKVENGASYVISGIGSLQFNVWSYESDTATYGKTHILYNNTSVRTFVADADYVRISIGGGDAWSIREDIFLEKGTTPSGFTPIELCKIGTHQDRIYKDSEGWKLHKEVGKRTFTGATSENWLTETISSTKKNAYIAITDALGNGSECYSDKFRRVESSANTEWGDMKFGGTNQNFILYNGISLHGENWRTWLASNTPSVYYPLATPTDTLITNSALIEQLDQLSTLATAKGYNLVFTATEHEQPTLAFEYYRPDPTVTKDEYIWVENHYEQLGGHKKFAHNLTVNTHTALGHWQYSFQITTDTHEHFTQLSQVAKYIADHHAGLTLPISGTYTEGNDIYFITKLEGYSSTQVAIEMRKLSDGSLRRITTGAVDVMDYIS